MDKTSNQQFEAEEMIMQAPSMREIEDLFLRASELSGPQQDDFLASECGDDPELRNQVEELLQADAEPDEFFDSPPAIGSAGPTIERFQ